jgi:hypothetical protein
LLDKASENFVVTGGRETKFQGSILPHPFSEANHLRDGARVSRFAPYRFAVAAGLLLAFWSPLLSAEDGAVGSRPAPANPSFIVIGFTGGFVRHDNSHQGPVQLATRIRQNFSKDTYVQVFENRRRRQAFHTIVHLLDSDHDGSLSNEERARAHVILFGHSWGASAVVLLARELDRERIPVLLTVQVDSVAKPWQRDGIISDNVLAAANFYQPHGFIHGRSLIRAEDESKTQILGNYRFDYHLNPVACSGFSWFDHAFMSNHMQSMCDPHLWNQVEGLVRERLDPAPVLAGIPKP